MSHFVDEELENLDVALSNGKVRDWFSKVFKAETGIDSPFEASDESEASVSDGARMVARVDPDAELIYNAVLSGRIIEKKDKSKHTNDDKIIVRALQNLIGLTGTQVDGIYGPGTAKQLGMLLRGSGSIDKITVDIAREIRSNFTEYVPADTTSPTRGTRSEAPSGGNSSNSSNSGKPDIYDLIQQLGLVGMQTTAALDRVKEADAQRLEDMQNGVPPQSAAPPPPSATPWGLYVGGAVALTVLGVGLYVVLKKND